MAMSELERVLIAQVQQAEKETENLVTDASAVLCEIVRQINMTDNTADGLLTKTYPTIDDIRTKARTYIRLIGGRCSY